MKHTKTPDSATRSVLRQFMSTRPWRKPQRSQGHWTMGSMQCFCGRFKFIWCPCLRGGKTWVFWTWKHTYNILKLNTMQPNHLNMRWDDIITSIRATEKSLELKGAASRSLGFAWWSRKWTTCLEQLLQKYLWHGGMGSNCISLAPNAPKHMEFNHHVQNSFWHRYWDALSNRTHQIATNYHQCNIAAFKLTYLALNQSQYL